jgi:hypothetical protein
MIIIYDSELFSSGSISMTTGQGEIIKIAAGHSILSK